MIDNAYDVHNNNCQDYKNRTQKQNSNLEAGSNEMQALIIKLKVQYVRNLLQIAIISS